MWVSPTLWLVFLCSSVSILYPQVLEDYRTLDELIRVFRGRLEGRGTSKLVEALLQEEYLAVQALGSVLHRFSIFWLSNWDELVLSIIVAGSTFFLWPRLSRKFQLTSADEWLFYTDTLSLRPAALHGLCCLWDVHCNLRRSHT